MNVMFNIAMPVCDAIIVFTIIRTLHAVAAVVIVKLDAHGSNADHTRRIRKGRDVTKSDACAQKTHRTHAVCIQLKDGITQNPVYASANGPFWEPAYVFREAITQKTGVFPRTAYRV